MILSAIVVAGAPFIPSHANFDADSDGARISEFFLDEVELQVLQAWLHPFGAGLFFAALICVYPRLHSSERAHRGMGPTLLIAGGSLFAITVAGFVVVVAALNAANDGFDPHVALLVYNTGWGMMVFTGAYLAPFVILPFGVIVRGAGLPRWLAATSIALGVPIAATAVAGLAAAGQLVAFFGFILFLVWTLCAGIALASAGPAPPAHEP